MTKFLPALLYGLIAVMVLAMVPGCGPSIDEIRANDRRIWLDKKEYQERTGEWPE